MLDVVSIINVFLFGFLMGGFFFGGLLWTVDRGLRSPHPALWFFASLIVRLGVVIGCFFLVCNGQWQNLLICTAGFLIARFLLIRFVRSSSKFRGSIKGAHDATKS